jgi:hypothetical protein
MQNHGFRAPDLRPLAAKEFDFFDYWSYLPLISTGLLCYTENSYQQLVIN